MVTDLNLYYRNEKTIIAHLTADKVEIYDIKLTKFLKGGITFPRVWVKEFGFPNKIRISPGEDDRFYAKAFLEDYFVHGLMQGGYHWRDQEGRDVEIWDMKKKKIVGTIEAIFSKEITQLSEKITSLSIDEEKTSD